MSSLSDNRSIRPEPAESPEAPRPEPFNLQAALVRAIRREFEAWRLSAAESDVAWFILKGLSLHEIADLRGTSERTVRQQAHTVYVKSGVRGRCDLAGHILDQCLSAA